MRSKNPDRATVQKCEEMVALPIKELEGAAVGYRGLDIDLMDIKQSVEQKKRYDAALQAQFKNATDRLKTLIGRTPIDADRPKLVARCAAEVARELPVDSFYVPED